MKLGLLTIKFFSCSFVLTRLLIKVECLPMLVVNVNLYLDRAWRHIGAQSVFVMGSSPKGIFPFVGGCVVRLSVKQSGTDLRLFGKRMARVSLARLEALDGKAMVCRHQGRDIDTRCAVVAFVGKVELEPSRGEQALAILALAIRGANYPPRKITSGAPAYPLGIGLKGDVLGLALGQGEMEDLRFGPANLNIPVSSNFKTANAVLTVRADIVHVCRVVVFVDNVLCDESHVAAIVALAANVADVVYLVRSRLPLIQLRTTAELLESLENGLSSGLWQVTLCVAALDSTDTAGPDGVVLGSGLTGSVSGFVDFINILLCFSSNLASTPGFALAPSRTARRAFEDSFMML